MNEIKLPPLPAGYAPEIAAAMRNYARAAIKANLQTNQITGETSDGYHTFNELYAHRVRLFCLLMHAHKGSAWWSHKHHDNSKWEGWIIAGIDTPEGSITYHLPVSEIENLPEGIELPKGKEWDGHTSDDVLVRLLSLRQARDSLISKYQEKVRALEADNHILVAEIDELKRRDEPVAWMTEDGRVATSETKETSMPRVAQESFKIPLYTALQPQQQSKSESISSSFGSIKIGNLPTMNQDDYPDLGDWWVQLRIGPDNDEVLARVYGDTPQQAYVRAVLLADQKPQQIPQDFLRSVINLCTHHGSSPFAIEGFDPEDKWIADLWRKAEAMLIAAPEP